jgi:hypothetical protein
MDIVCEERGRRFVLQSFSRRDGQAEAFGNISVTALIGEEASYRTEVGRVRLSLCLAGDRQTHDAFVSLRLRTTHILGGGE